MRLFDIAERNKRGDEAVDHCREDHAKKHLEPSVVVSANTLSNEDTVMIVFINAYVADAAVSGPFP